MYFDCKNTKESNLSLEEKAVKPAKFNSFVSWLKKYKLSFLPQWMQPYSVPLMFAGFAIASGASYYGFKHWRLSLSKQNFKSLSFCSKIKFYLNRKR